MYSQERIERIIKNAKLESHRAGVGDVALMYTQSKPDVLISKALSNIEGMKYSKPSTDNEKKLWNSLSTAIAALKRLNQLISRRNS